MAAILPQADATKAALNLPLDYRGTMPFPDLPQTEAAIIEMTNSFRAENRLAGVRVNATLAKAAKAYAEYLARTGKFAHEADGRQPADRTQAAGYRHCIVAENLALNQYSLGFQTRELAIKAVDGWKGSPAHRAAMLNPHVTEIGVGIAKGPDKDARYLSVQLFGRPESMKFTFKVINAADSPIVYGFGDKTHTVPTSSWIAHTACTPGAVTVEGVPTQFKATEGSVFKVTRAATGKMEVEMSAAAASAVQLATRRK
jgi:uncharacterized protein YkwD